MDCHLPYNKSPTPRALPVQANCTVQFSFSRQKFAGEGFRRHLLPPSKSSSMRKWIWVVASGEASHFKFSVVNTPLEPESPAGTILTGVLQDRPESFHGAVDKQLKQLADECDTAAYRMLLSTGSSEFFLHRRIAELRKLECQQSVEDIMYTLILFQFSKIRVHMVPKLSRCIYNGRLELWPSKDWELESIYCFEVLQMIREHVSSVIGLRPRSSVVDIWATTQIERFRLGEIYVSSILYGYFLKSASLRLNLEVTLALAQKELPHGYRNFLSFPPTRELKNFIRGCILHMSRMSQSQGPGGQEKKREQLRCYVLGFDSEAVRRCAKLKSKEARNLVQKHSRALFEYERAEMVQGDGVISTSFASLKRLVMEAVAFGFFLWDAEEYVDALYKLQEE